VSGHTVGPWVIKASVWTGASKIDPARLGEALNAACGYLDELESVRAQLMVAEGQIRELEARLARKAGVR
jgi:hypothetical protein